MLATLRFALRRLARAPGFTAAAVLTLTLGIGGTVAVFTLVNGVLLRPLPYRQPEQLVDLSHTLTLSGISRIEQSDATYLLYRRDNRVFTDVGAYRAAAVNLGGVAGGVAAERVSATLVTAGVFNVLAVAAERGRVLTDDDTRPGAPAAVVLSRGLWERRFAGDPGMIGERVTIDGTEREIVGVMPASFRFPTGDSELWLPIVIDPARMKTAAFDFRGIARLRDGVPAATATAELTRLLPRVPEVFPGRLTLAGIKQIKMQPVVLSQRDAVVGDVGRALWIVLGGVGALLLIACANVANLFLARAEARQRELVVRRALGAGRGALLADFVAEGAIVATVGAVLGLAGAAGGSRILQTLGAPATSTIPRLAEVGVDGVVLVVTAGLAALAALVVSAMPVARLDATSLSAALLTRGAIGGRVRQRARRGLVIAQVALALVLLVGAGLFAQSFARLRSLDPGFKPDHALAWRVSLPAVTYPAAGDAASMLVRAIDAVSALPGVEAVGVATKLPLDPEARQDSAVFVANHPLPMSGIPNIHEIVFATPGYFAAMGIPLVAGRNFERPDPAGLPANGPPEVIVSEAFASRYWPGQVAIGKRLRMNPTDPWHTVVGVVGSMRDVALDQPPGQVVYAPLVTMTVVRRPWVPHDVAFVARSTGDASRLTTPVRNAIAALDPALPLYRLTPVSTLQARSTARTTFTLFLLGVAAVVATVIGALGIYGVISYLVSLRTREIGVRIALGAQSADVRRLVAGQALVDALVGVGLGLAGAVVVTRALSALLFGVRPTDPATLAAASVLLLGTALLASWLPARRAAMLDPAKALREE